MTEELLIDNQAVDLNSGTAVTLNFKSNILGDVDAIESNYSQTISLPKTAHNRAVLDNPTAPAYGSSFRRVRHPAKYRRNGVEVIHDGYAVLMDSKDSYEIALYWGIKAQLQSWLDAGESLADLGWEPSLGNKAWNNTHDLTKYSSVDVTSPYQGFVWAAYDCGLGYPVDANARDLAAPHPFVSALTLLDLVATAAGITVWNVTDDLKREISRAAIFLCTHNTTDAGEYTALSVGNGLDFRFSDNNYFTVDRSSGAAIITVKYSGTARVRLSGSFTSVYNACRITVYRNESAVYKADFAYTAREEIGSDGIGVSDIYQYWYTYSPSVNVSFSCDADDEIRIVMSAMIFNNEADLTLAFTPPVENDPIGLGDSFPASNNMPDITQLDFLKAVCAMFGLYVMPTAGDEGLQLCTLESLTGNRDNAVDWSERLVSSGVAGEPSETAFSLGDWARHNWFKYAEDDDVATSGDGDLPVADERLDDERDAVELPFSATDPKTILLKEGCLIRHFGWDNDTDTEEDEEGNEIEVTVYGVEEEDVNPRVVSMAERDDGYCQAQFSPLKFSNLLSHHATLAALLDDAIVITEEFRLTEFDLLNLDYLKPVYLRQYGRYYGIVSIQTKDDNICEAELVQLPLPTE